MFLLISASPVGFWPLTPAYQGNDSSANSLHITFSNVVFTDDGVQLSGDSGSGGLLPASPALNLKTCMSWFSQVYLDVVQDGSLFSWVDGIWKVHIWVYTLKFYARIVHLTTPVTCPHLYTFSAPLASGQWYNMAMNYESSTGLLNLWLDGQLTQKQAATPCVSELDTTGNVYVGEWSVRIYYFVAIN